MSDEKKYTLKAKDDYIHLATRGKLDIDDLDAPVNAALELAKEKGIDLLLDDIRDIDSTSVSIHLQTKAMGLLWRLRTFKKVAIVLEGSRIQTLFESTLNVLHLHLDSRFKGFDNTKDAIAWLHEK